MINHYKKIAYIPGKPRATFCVYVCNPKQPKSNSYTMMDNDGPLFTKITLTIPFPYLFPFPNLRKKKNYRCHPWLLAEICCTSIAISHRKMSQNFVVRVKYQAAQHEAKATSTATKLGCYKFSFGAPSTYVYLPINKDRLEWINFHPLLRRQKKKVWTCSRRHGRIYFEILPSEDAGREEKHSDSPSWVE